MPETANLNRLAYFAAVIDAGSFTRAADHLGITKAVVSQQVAKLEQEVGTTLLVRTTRRLQPTEAGSALHAHCVRILREAEEAFAELAQARAEPRGVLRLTAPYDYGTAIVVPLVTAFIARYPACKVELDLSDETLDLVAGQFDLAIRVGWLADSSQQARRIASFHQFLVGAPDHVRRLAHIKNPIEALDLPFIANTALLEPLQWTFSKGDAGHETVLFKAAISINTTPAVHRALLQGGGISVLPDFLVAEDLRTGRLSRVLPDWSLPIGGVHTVYPAGRFRPRKVTAFVAMLTESLK
jgi:DNA-binding transcriptional LysR family regulator